MNRTSLPPSSSASRERVSRPGAFWLIGLTWILAMALSSQARADIVAFQHGVDGYFGVRDTDLINNQGDNSQKNPLNVQFGGQFSTKNALIQFDQIFGNGNSQIPLGSHIVSATLELRTHDFSDSAGGRVNLHRMLMPWDQTDNATAYGQSPWNSLKWIQADDFEARSTVSAFFDPDAIDTPYSVDVTADLQAWADGAPYYGWVFLGDPSESDQVGIVSSESATSSYRPRLVIQFNAVPEPGVLFPIAVVGTVALLRRRRRALTT